jgi:hypothetical protein
MEECSKLHLEKFHKNFKKKKKKKDLITVDVKERVDNTSNQEGNISCTIFQKEVVLVGCSHKEYKEIIDLFFIKINMK